MLNKQLSSECVQTTVTNLERVVEDIKVHEALKVSLADYLNRHNREYSGQVQLAYEALYGQVCLKLPELLRRKVFLIEKTEKHIKEFTDTKDIATRLKALK